MFSSIKKRQVLLTALLTCLFAIAFCFTALADIGVTKTGEIAKSCDLTWYVEGGADEYRILAGSSDESGWDGAEYAGHGGSATKTVKENGNYTLYAKNGDEVIYIVETVTNIDNTSPDIVIVGMVKNEDGTYDVSYTCDDYFSDCEVRIVPGAAGVGDFPKGTAVSDGVIKSVKPGEYTLLAKDKAGNIASYYFTADGNTSEFTNRKEYSVEDPESESYEYHSNDLTYTYETNSSGGYSSLVVSKIDGKTGKGLAGAKLSVRVKETGEVIDEWVTTCKTHTITGIPAGIEVEIVEISAPDGYKKAASQTVKTVKNTYQNITVKNMPKTAVVQTETAEPVEKLPQTGGFDTGMKVFIASIICFLAAALGLLLLNGKVRAGRK